MICSLGFPLFLLSFTHSYWPLQPPVHSQKPGLAPPLARDSLYCPPPFLICPLALLPVCLVKVGLVTPFASCQGRCETCFSTRVTTSHSYTCALSLARGSCALPANAATRSCLPARLAAIGEKQLCPCLSLSATAFFEHSL